MSAAEAVFHAKAPADKKASAQAAIRKRFLMVVIMGLLSGEGEFQACFLRISRQALMKQRIP